MATKQTRKPTTKATTKPTTKPTTKTAANASTKTDDVGMCRGRWSTCEGREPSLSAKWHLGAECTKAYRAGKRAAHAPEAAADNVVSLPVAAPAAAGEVPAEALAAFATVELAEKATAQRRGEKASSAPARK